MKSSLSKFFLPALLFLALVACPMVAEAIQVTGSSLPDDVVLPIQTGQVSYSVEVEGTDGEVNTPYIAVVYVTGRDIYGNTIYIEVQRTSFALSGKIGAQDPTTFTIGGENARWVVPNDGTLHSLIRTGSYDPAATNNVVTEASTGGYRLCVAVYSVPPGVPADINDLTTGRVVFLQSGRIDIDVLPDLAVGGPGDIPGVTYQAGRYRGSDIIQFSSTWINDPVGEGSRQSRPLRSTVPDYYAADLRLTTNPAFGDTNNDDFLLSRLVFQGDAVAIPDGSSVVRKVEVTGTPLGTADYDPTVPNGALNPYGLDGVDGTERDYTPQPDDGFLDIGETVQVDVEQLIPENYSGAYFVALRTAMSTYEDEDAATNNTFVSNAANKIEILETASPTLEPASAVSTDNGTYVQGGNAASDYSSVSEDGDNVAFASRASNLLFLPATASGISTSGQQIFVKNRQTREVTLASSDASGVPANADCFNPSISADGRYVAFDSRASNLIQEATGSRSMIYIYDTATSSVVVISRSSSNVLANGDCFNPQLSQSGRFVVFESKARNLDAARPIPASNSNQQVFLHDRDSDADGIFDEAGNIKTYLISVNGSGAVANGWCANPALNLEDSTAQIGSNGGMVAAFTSYAANMPSGSGYAMVYRVKVDPATGPSAATVTAVSVNDIGAAPEAVGVDPVGAFIQPFADEAAVNGDGSQIAFTSAANNFVYNPDNGTFVPTFPNNDPNDPAAPVDPAVLPAGDYNRVPDIFVRDFKAGTTVRVSVSQPRVATGTITFAPPPLVDYYPQPGNVPLAQPLPGESITINDGASSVTLVFDTDVAIGASVFETRANLVDAINASGLNIVAYASNPPTLYDPLTGYPGTGYFPSIFLRNFIPGSAGNWALQTDSANLTVVGMSGGGIQAEDDALAPGNTDVAPIQGVPFGSNQPSIDRSGRFVAFRSIATNLDVHVATPENTYPTSPATGELIRPLLFPTSNVYLHDRQADSDPASGFDAPLNSTTERMSLNNFGYKTLIDFTEQSGLEATQSANSSRPALSANGRFVSFSSDAFGEGGLVFGPNNLTPLDSQNVKDVFIRDQRTVGNNPPAPTTRPTITINSPAVGLRVQAGSTIRVNVSAEARGGKSISSVQLFVNGVSFGAPLAAEPFSWEYTLPTTGSYSFRAVVTDSKGITSSDSVSVAATAPVPPTIAITSPQSGLVTPQATLSVAWSASDSDGYVSKVQLLVNGVVTSEQQGGAAIVSYSPPSQGKYVFVARATDDLGNTTDSAATTVVVDNTKPPVIPIVNLLPVTFADANYVVGSQLYFNATAAARSGAILNSNSVRFYLYGADVYESASVTKILMGTNPVYASGMYTISSPVQQVLAEAMDSAGTIGSSPVYQFDGRLSPLAPLPTVDILTSLPPSSVPVAGGIIPLRARASFPGTSITNVADTRVEFYADGAFIGAANAVTNGTISPSGFTHFLDWVAPANTNSFKITARAVGPNFTVATSTNSGLGSGGASGGSASIEKYYGSTISAGILTINTFTNAAPSISITTPSTNGAQFPVGSTNLIVASVTTATNTSVKEVQWYVDGSAVATDTNYPYSYSFAPSATGLYNIAAIAVDKFGLLGSSDVRTVSVVSGTPPSVAIIAPVATDQFFSGEKFTIAAAASGNGATITGVEFFVNGLSIGADADSLSPFTIDYTPPAPGSYSIYARATDSRGNVKDSATVNIVVQGINPNDPVIQGKVLEVYQKLLSRVPTAAENQYWVGALSGGTTESTMITQLMGTAEYNDYQNKLLGYYYKLNVAPVNSTYLQQLGYMAIDRGALPPPANYPPQGPSNLAPSYGAVNGDARAAKAIVDSPAFNSANPGVQFYGDQQFMVWYFGQWPYGVLGSPADLVTAMGASQFKQGYAAAFINALAYAARDTSAFDYQLKATSFLWLYYGVWQKNTTPAVSTAAQLKAYIQTLLGEPVVTTRPLSPKLSAGAASLSRFTTTQGTPSLPKQFSVAGEDLAGQVTIAADPGFEVSTDGVNYSQTLQLSPQTTGTAVQVRVSTTAAIGSLRKSVRVLAEGVPTCTVQVSAQVKRPKKGKAK